ncbi:TspO/MBR family protein [Clostridium sp. Marseille-Q2269]|uniref:TspO/MBR family protein n=1 Tax=Clostridium sp. Marseille-Q2269 TaxID=2942205 RepID=UPI00207482C8|nr:TspO/MBR family protein [Clostridium sp. Marseille-Q2269]
MNIFKVKHWKDIKLLIFIVIAIESLGLISGFLGMVDKNLYTKLIKPAFSPPGWVFPVVWTILYLLMAVALYKIIIKGKQGEDISKALVYFFIQLALNFLWTIIFFRFRLYGVAFLELLLLLIFILLTTFEFYKIDKVAAYLMIPYIIWVSFAGILNYSIWILNR